MVAMAAAVVSIVAIVTFQRPTTVHKGVASAPTPKKKEIVGVFAQRIRNQPGGPFRFEFHSDGRWAMGNVMSAWWGTWRKRGDVYELTSTDSPSGRVVKQRADPIEFDNGDVIAFGEGSGKWIFDRMPSNEPYLIPFTGTSIDR